MQKMAKRGFRGERKGILTPSLSQGEGECRDEKLKETSPFSHTPLSRTSVQRGNVASHLLGKPPNPRRGTSWKRRQTSSLIHISLSRCTYPAIAGYLKEGELVTEKGRNDEGRMMRGYL